MTHFPHTLQSAHLAFPEIDEKAVYLTAGAVLPEAVHSILHTLLNSPFDECYASLLQVFLFCLHP